MHSSSLMPSPKFYHQNSTGIKNVQLGISWFDVLLAFFDSIPLDACLHMTAGNGPNVKPRGSNTPHTVTKAVVSLLV